MHRIEISLANAFAMQMADIIVGGFKFHDVGNSLFCEVKVLVKVSVAKTLLKVLL